MTKSLNIFSTKMEDAFDLGTWIGRKQAFSELAGRCSAADAECLRQVRDKKRYRSLKMTWEQFCRERIGISRGTAEKIIRLLEEFGPQYFVLAHATGINADEYRRISGAVHEKHLLCAGEEIPIDADHAPKLNAAIEQLRRELPSLPAEATAEGASADTEAKTGADQISAEVVGEMKRARRDAHAGLDRYKQILTRRLEPHMRTLLISALHILAGRAQDLWEEALRR